MAEVVVGKITKRKFAITRTLPEKVRFDTLRQRFGVAEQLARRWRRIAQKHVARLDLGALAGRRLNLQRRVVVGHDRARFKGAFFFKNDVHSWDYNPQNSKSCGNNSGNWVKL